MFCRRAWQRVGPLARRAFQPPSRTAPVRHMAFGVPGGSSNMTYFLLCGGGLTAAVVYAYKTVSGDSERYEDRLANMGSATRASLLPAPAVETAPVEEPAPATEVIAESVPTPAGPVAETAAEPVTEVTLDSEVVVAAAEPVVTEEAATPAASEASPVAATVETPAEALAAESAGMAAVDEVPPAPPSEAEIAHAAPEAEATSAAEVAA
ncbi:induced stolen tip protein TUB8-like isoform X2 [Mastacembelus armatus]|uniref:induced stolen tip protein TUB8-like isoform X2 n=1 Tax=Mastacembelus armatus TaxID=205130 RepID=UPI000E45827D|nr:protein MGARP isoform X2 [Mastacembelus armatus]